MVRHTSELHQVVEDEDIVVGVLAVPTRAAQGLADELVEAGVKIIFNYSESLLAVPPEVTVHTSSPAVDLLYALYFYSDLIPGFARCQAFLSLVPPRLHVTLILPAPIPASSAGPT